MDEKEKEREQMRDIHTLEQALANIRDKCKGEFLFIWIDKNDKPCFSYAGPSFSLIGMAKFLNDEIIEEIGPRDDE